MTGTSQNDAEAIEMATRSSSPCTSIVAVNILDPQQTKVDDLAI